MEKLRKALGLARDGWTIVGVTLVVFLALECLARVYYFVRKRDHSSQIYSPEGGQFPTDEREFSDIYEATDWGDDYFREKYAANVMTWRSYVYWRKRPFSGEHINVDENGVRTTFNPAPDSSSKPGSSPSAAPRCGAPARVTTGRSPRSSPVLWTNADTVSVR
jgi:hypothetical protein